MADLTGKNSPSPPQMQPWLIPLPIPLHQLSFTCIDTSCMAQISPFFPRLCLTFFKNPSIFPARPQGVTPPPGFALTTAPYAAINNYGAYRFAQSGRGFYGAVGGLCFVGPYGYLCLPPIQFQLKVYGRLQTGTSMEQQEQHNRISPSPRIVELETRGTGVFHAPDIKHGTRNNKRRRKRGKRNENAWVEETAEGSTRSAEGEGAEQQEEEQESRQSDEPNYGVVLPGEWPY